MKKRIGISYTTIKFHNYLSWFTEQELQQVELVELSFEKNNTEDFTACDGFILTGGEDIDPALYGGNANYPHRPASFHTDRDHFETAIFHYAQTHHLRVLGICRGLQLINVICKGTLIQDLGDDSLNKFHKGEPDKLHGVTIVKETLLHNITGIVSGEVNSAHHQAIDTLGEGLIINCRAGDGTIEGIEWENKNGKPFMLAVQWHPERMKDKEQNPLSIKLKERFLDEL